MNAPECPFVEQLSTSAVLFFRGTFVFISLSEASRSPLALHTSTRFFCLFCWKQSQCTMKKNNLKCQLQKQFSHHSVKYKHINSHLQTLQRHQMLHANMLMIGADYWLAWLYVNHPALPLRGWMKGSPLKKDEPSSPSCLGLLSAEVLPPGKQGRQRNHCNQHILNIIHIKTKGWDKNKGFLLVRHPLNF